MNEIEILNQIKSAAEAETPEILENILLAIKNCKKESNTKREHLSHIRKIDYKNFHT
ncbi:hypothetical protein ACRQU7_01500 [Caproiciproducens sp. R1]|uniref:hypothetical protein n=1 Tax=Acutalibacteraceae TaxID=3082771 RepID=UPI002E1487BD